MSLDKKGLGIIFHSGSYDRVLHGLLIALAGLALGREVRLFFSYWALEYFKKKGRPSFLFDKEAESHKGILEKNIEKGHLEKPSLVIAQIKAMGGELYACTNSMGILNISRDELVSEVDKSMGITTFLTETQNFQILFI